MAADAGLERAKSFFKSVSFISKLNVATIDRVESISTAVDSFSSAIDLGYEMLWNDGQSFTHIRASIDALSTYIRKNSGQRTVNAYLEDQGLQVRRTYAQLSNLVGQTIDSENIQQE